MQGSQDSVEEAQIASFEGKVFLFGYIFKHQCLLLIEFIKHFSHKWLKLSVVNIWDVTFFLLSWENIRLYYYKYLCHELCDPPTGSHLPPGSLHYSVKLRQEVAYISLWADCCRSVAIMKLRFISLKVCIVFPRIANLLLFGLNLSEGGVEGGFISSSTGRKVLDP